MIRGSASAASKARTLRGRCHRSRAAFYGTTRGTQRTSRGFRFLGDWHAVFLAFSDFSWYRAASGFRILAAIVRRAISGNFRQYGGLEFLIMASFPNNQV